MNKKMLLAGAAALVGFFMLTAFAGKTLEQQKAEISTAVTAKLEEFRAMKTEECLARTTAEAQTRFMQYMAEVEVAAAKTGKTGTTKGKSKSGTKVDPLPQPTTPTPVKPKDDKMQGGTGTQEKQDKMQGAPNTDAKKKKMGGGGN